MTVPRALDPQYVATLEAKTERLQEDNDQLLDLLKWAMRVIKTNEATLAEFHTRLVKALER